MLTSKATGGLDRGTEEVIALFNRLLRGNRGARDD